jgi:hypothetical protein
MEKIGAWELKEAFYSYITIVESELQARSEQLRRPPEKKRLLLHRNKAIELRALVEALENEIEFHFLVEQTHSSLSGTSPGQSERAWQQAVKNYFRRSGYYIDVFEGKIPNDDAVFQNYCKAFERRECIISYLALIEHVQFSGASMDFGTFQ